MKARGRGAGAAPGGPASGAATIREVAAASGVSTATVSRVLSGSEPVAPGTAARVLGEVKRLGYTVNHVARSLKTRSTRTVGLIAPELSSDFFMLLAESMDSVLSPLGYGLLVCSSRGSEEEEGKRMRLLAERLVDGVVFIPSTGSGEALAAACPAGTPVVLVDRGARGLAADAVLADNEGGAYEATRALAADGHRRIGFAGGSLEISTARERYEGWRRAMLDSGLEPEPDFTSFLGMSVRSGHEAMRLMRARPGAPDAWFVVNAYAHLGATNYLATEEPPERSSRVALAAFDETPYAPLLRFCRYSVTQPVAEMGARAASILLRRMSGDESLLPVVARLPTELKRHDAPRREEERHG